LEDGKSTMDRNLFLDLFQLPNSSLKRIAAPVPVVPA